MVSDEIPGTGEVSIAPTSIRDGSDPKSLINMLTGKLRESVLMLKDELLLKSEGELRKAVRPTPTDHALRVSFWREFEKVMWRGTGNVQAKDVVGGICTEQYFYQKFMKDPRKVAWLVRPMQTYEKEMDAILHRCTERLWELVNIKIYNGKGKLDARAADVLLKAVTQVENRVKGMAVQRSEQRSLNVNVQTRSKAVEGIETMSGLDNRIKQLEAEVNGEDSSDDRGEEGIGYGDVIQIEAQDEKRECFDISTLRREGEPERVGDLAHSTVQERISVDSK